VNLSESGPRCDVRDSDQISTERNEGKFILAAKKGTGDLGNVESTNERPRPDRCNQQWEEEEDNMRLLGGKVMSVGGGKLMISGKLYSPVVTRPQSTPFGIQAALCDSQAALCDSNAVRCDSPSVNCDSPVAHCDSQHVRKPSISSPAFGNDSSNSNLRPACPSPGRGSPQTCSSTTNTQVKEEDEPPRRICLVCGDSASGFHYGVSSCEACKAFFKRTIQGNINYTCPGSGDCEINKRRRKACQACRYHKCLRKGMLREGVRLDRVRGGRQKYRRISDVSLYGDFQPIRRVSLEDNLVLEGLSSCEPEPISIQGCDYVECGEDLRTSVLLADIYDRELVLTIGWAKQVPGFSDLSLNDQMNLLKSSWTEVLTLTLVYRSLPFRGAKLNFASDFSLNRLQADEAGLLAFFQKCMHIVERLEKLGIFKEEYLILKSLVLSNPDSNLESPSVVESLREAIMTSLQDCVGALRCMDSGLIVQQLLLVLPSLREADHLLRTYWSNVRKDGIVPMNRLLVEMLEI